MSIYPGSVDGSKEDEDVVAGRDCICRLTQCTWWEWEEGYCCFLLRWPREFRRAIRDKQKKWKVETWIRFVLPQI